MKPDLELAVLARKPLDGTVANNVAKWGCGALAIDACRIEGESTRRTNTAANSYMTSDIGAKQDVGAAYETGSDKGRWPANVMLDEEAGAALDAQSGNRPSTLTGRASPNESHQNPSKVRPVGWLGTTGGGVVYADAGGASRFYYCAKVSKSEREAGCEALDSPRTGAGPGDGKARNHHPTLKPIALTRWLASLIKPPTGDATLLVPFSGAGSEMIGAMQAGWPSVVGIERDAEYVAIAKARIKHAKTKA